MELLQKMQDLAVTIPIYASCSRTFFQTLLCHIGTFGIAIGVTLNPDRQLVIYLDRAEFHE